MPQPQHHVPAAPQRPSTSARTASMNPRELPREAPRRSKPTNQVLPPRRPTNEQIAQRAYALYLARGAVDGHAQEDWARAERELTLGRL